MFIEEQSLNFLKLGGEIKISNYEFELSVNKQVLWLYVSVHYPLAVQVAEALD